ncbi:MAG TPA: FtsX-like permease family protein, partial [Candidatus Cloacimonas sp.]|nr:FtsX-like permease family protein [Candidatus Cloacimonas sp.]
GVMSERFMQSQGGQIGMGDNALEYLNQRCFIPISTMISKVNPISKISSIDIRAKSPEEAKELRRKVENIVLNLKNGKRLFQVTSAKEQMDTMQANAKIMEAIFILIAVISLLVGGIVIMNIMLASIRERTREIGVRIAVGARSRDIFLQFLVQTILITSLGGVLGILFGFAILDKVGSYLQIEVLASVQMIWVALLVSIGVGLIFGVGPAIRASRLDPVIALREE